MNDEGPPVLPATAFRHYPALRDKVIPPAQSTLREMDFDRIRGILQAAGMPEWLRPEDDREAHRRATIDARPDPGLWVFAFATLMWDPALVFDELRRAHTPDHARRFVLRDTVGRGTADRPGLQAALDAGAGCTGYALHIPPALVDRESRHLWCREMLSWGYRAEFIPVDTPQGPVRALAFLANPASGHVMDLTIPQQAEMIAVAEGVLGPNRDSIFTLITHLADLGIDDPGVADLHAALLARLAGQGGA